MGKVWGCARLKRGKAKVWKGIEYQKYGMQSAKGT
jgi:hypothetical protein